MLEGKGRQGARLAAITAGFELQDEEAWEWLRKNLFIEGGEEEPSGGIEERSPYPGLASFTSADAELFYGREREAEAFLNRLRVQPLLAVVGPSGAGKSSFVQAGVIPALELSEGARVVRVDRWPSDEKPLRWLVNEMFRALDVGVAPDEKSPIALKKAILFATNSS